MSRRKSRRRIETKSVRRDDPVGLPGARRLDRKTLQLAEQVRQALNWVLGSVVRDERLALCHVISVEPLAGGNRMLVKVGVPADVSLGEVVNGLAVAAPALRAEVAQSITRRKVPELVYTAVPAG